MREILRKDITGLVLAGGQGSRMGGVDKGLETYRGVPLALHALGRLQPQVGTCMISANRNLDVYRGMGVPVWTDSVEGYAGPLAGLLSGMQHATTEWLVTVPCDTPEFPLDFVEKLSVIATKEGADIAMVATRDNGELHAQPVFCLLRRQLQESLLQYLDSGERKWGKWTAMHSCVKVPFDAISAFFNANTREDLQKLQNPG